MKIYRNIINLFIWQGSTYLVPLIVTPYLARTLGVKGFGIFGFSLAITVYGLLITNWGFDVSAAQRVARASDEPELLREIFWSTMTARIALAVVAYALLFIAVVSVPSLRAIWPALLASSLIVVSTALSANWFLQGLQAMGAFAIAALIGKLTIVPLMILFVHRPEDVPIALAIQNGTQLISSLVSLFISRRLVPLGRPIFDVRRAWEDVKDGWHFFASGLSVSLYTQASAVVVGLSAGPAAAGLLTGSQRVSQAFQQLVGPINMALFPQINKLTHSDPPAAVRMMFKVLKVQTAFAACLAIGMAVVAPWIVTAFLGKEFRSAIAVTQVLSAMPFLAGISNVLGGNMLLPLGLKRPYMTALMAAGAFNLVTLWFLAAPFGAIGGAWSAVITETFLVSLQAWGLYRNRAVFARMRAGERP